MRAVIHGWPASFWQQDRRDVVAVQGVVQVLRTAHFEQATYQSPSKGMAGLTAAGILPASCKRQACCGSPSGNSIRVRQLSFSLLRKRRVCNLVMGGNLRHSYCYTQQALSASSSCQPTGCMPLMSIMLPR